MKTKCQKVQQQVVSVHQHCDLCAWKWPASDMKYQKSRALESLERTTARTLFPSFFLSLSLAVTFSDSLAGDPDASFAPRRKRSAARAGGGRVEASPVAKGLQFSCQLNLWAWAKGPQGPNNLLCRSFDFSFRSLFFRLFPTFISSNTIHVRQKPWETMPTKKSLKVNPGNWQFEGRTSQAAVIYDSRHVNLSSILPWTWTWTPFANV